MTYKNILITGGAGFIGSNLAVSFKDKYPKVKITALDNLKRRGSELNIERLKNSGISFIHADIRNPEDLVPFKDIDLIIECSAEPSVLAGYGDNPAYIINTNLTGTINCLELARKNKSDVVFISTSRVYPFEAINSIKTKETDTRFEWLDNQKIEGWSKNGISENFTLKGPKTLYGATKLCSELLLQEYIDIYGLKGVINRCGVISGPWQFGKVDQGVFTYWLRSHYIKKDLKYIGFQGLGKQVRDLLHTEDLFKLIDIEIANLKRINGRIYNIGGGRSNSLSLLETTKLCQEITGNRVNIKKELANRKGDIKLFLSDNTKVKEELGWAPKKSPEQILLDIFKWVKLREKELNDSLL